MRQLLVACALVLGVGCSEAQRDLEEIEKRACSCNLDKACGEFMIDDVSAWYEKHKNDTAYDESDIRRSLTNTLGCIERTGASTWSLAMTLGAR